MSEFHASPPGDAADDPANVSIHVSIHDSSNYSSLSAALKDAGETLTDAQRTALRQGLAHTSLPRPHADFNAVVLAAVQSGQDFETLPLQAKTRLRWAALPAVIGFALMYGVAYWQIRNLPPPPAPYPRVNHGQPAPPLPDLPILSPQAKSAPVKSAFLNSPPALRAPLSLNSPSPNHAGASDNGDGVMKQNSPALSDTGAARRGVGVRSRSAAASTSLNVAAAKGGPRHDR